jgi:hypothetical protein
LHRKGTYECDGVKIVISSPLFSNNVKKQYRRKVWDNSIRKYAGRTIALEKQNYKTSKIAWGTSMTSWTFLINWRNWIIYIWDTNHSFHTEKEVIFFLNCYSWKTFCMLIEIKRNSHIEINVRNRLLTYMCMHGPNFNEMLETKENIFRLTCIMKINSPWNCKTMRRFN